MYCTKCGRKLDESDLFCRSCGNKVDGEPAKKSTKASPKKPTWLPWVLLAAVIVVAIVIVAVSLNGSGEEPYEPSYDVSYRPDGDVIVSTDPITEAVGPAVIPSPEQFFGVEATVDGRDWTLICPSDPSYAVERYVELLQSDYGMRITEENAPFDNLKRWDLCAKNDSEATVAVIKYYGNGAWRVILFVDETVQIEDGPAYDWSAETTPVTDPPATKAPETEPVETVKAGKGVLPSPDSFFGGQLARKTDEDSYWENKETGMIYEKGWQISFKSDAAGMEAFHDYAELLGSGDYALSLATKTEKTVSYMKYTYYIYECDGSDDPVQSIFRTSSQDEEKKGDLILLVNYNGNDGTSRLELHFDKSYFSFVDSGKTYSGKLKDTSGQSSSGGSSGGSSSGGSSSGGSIYDSKEDCSFCDGDGDCQTCDGYGYVYSYVSGYKKRDKNCKDCNTRGDCRYCNGTGKR